MKPIRVVQSAWLALLSVGTVAAEPSIDAPIDTVVVSATRSPREAFSLPVSADRVDGEGAISAGMQVNLSDWLGSVPGVVGRDRQNLAQDLQISVRGFGSRASFGVRGVRLFSDGIPATMPDGQGQVAHFDLSGGSVELLRGPFSVLYGNAAGGVIVHRSAEPPAGGQVEVALAAGADGQRRERITITQGETDWNLVANLGQYATDGYRDHSTARRTQSNLRGAWQVTPSLRFNWAYSDFSQPLAQDPLGLTRIQFEVDPRQAGIGALPFNTRKRVEQQQLGVGAEMKVGAGGTAYAALWKGTRDVFQMLSTPKAAQTAASSAGGVVNLDRSYDGAEIRWQQDLLQGALTLGLNSERSAETRTGYENFDGALLGVVGRFRRNEDTDVTANAAFVQLDYPLADAVSLLAGVRRSTVSFDTQDRYLTSGNPDDSGRRAYSATTPAIGLRWQPEHGLQLYLASGRGFETPTTAELAYRPDGSSGLNSSLDAARSRHVEVGAKARLTLGIVNATVFTIRTDDEILVASNSGGRTSFRNAGETKRDGWELAYRARLGLARGSRIELDVVATRLTARFGSGAGALVGKQLPGIPRMTWSMAGNWRSANDALELGASLRRDGPVFVNDANTDSAHGASTFGAHIALLQRSGPWLWREFIRVDNLTDVRYIGSVIVNEAQGRYFEPAPPRRVVAGVDLKRTF